VLVFDDFDVEQAVNYAAFGAFVGAGQTCICASRHIVQRKIYPEFVERLAAKAKTLRIGDPADPATQLGPVISSKQRSRVLGYVRRASPRRRSSWRAAARPGSTIPSSRTGTSSSPPSSRTSIRRCASPARRSSALHRGRPLRRRGGGDPHCQRFRRSASPRRSAPATSPAPIVVAAKFKCGIVWVNDHTPRSGAAVGRREGFGHRREFGTESFEEHFDVKTVMVKYRWASVRLVPDTSGQKRLN